VTAPAFRRGEVWTVAAGSGFMGKPRPAIVIQDERSGITSSVTLCGVTTDPIQAPDLRPFLEPTEENGLRQGCRMMVDKISTVSSSGLGEHIGRLSAGDMARVDHALLTFLGLLD
jgi:mRNA interferase MazF